MPRIADPKCPNCHADLPVVPDATTLKCQYCGNEVMVKKTQYHQAQPPPQQGPPMHLRDAVKLAHQFGNVKPIKVNPLIIIVPIVLVLGGVGFAVYMGVKKARDAQKRVSNIASKHKVDRAARQNPENASWITYNRQITAQVNGDFIDDLVLLARFHNDDDNVYLVAIDGATRKRIWKAGHFGDVSNANAHTQTKFKRVGDVIVLIDHKSTARVLDLKTGQEQRSVTLSDRGEWICTYPDDTAKVWIEVIDKKHVNLDIATAQTSPAPNRPKGCLQWSARVDCPDAGAATCVPDRMGRRTQFKDPAGMQIGYGLRDDKAFIGFGTKHPGTTYPMIAGLTSNGKKANWTRRVVEDVNANVNKQEPDQADVANGNAYLVYELGNDRHHLIAIGGTDGKTLWDIELPREDTLIPPDPDGVIASQTRIYVIDRSTINVFDPADGSLFGSVSTSE